MGTTQIEVTPAWASYLDLQQDVKPYLQIPATNTGADAQLQMLTDTACTWVQNYLGRPIAPLEVFRRFNGWTGLNGAYINLPYYPVLSVTSVVEYWGVSGPHTLTEQIPSNQGGQDVFQMDYLRGIVIRTFTGLVQRPWFPGSRNIEITWVAGYNPVPADIRHATLRTIKSMFDQEQQAARLAPGGPMPAGMDREDQAGAGIYAGVPEEVERFLQPYVQIGIG